MFFSRHCLHGRQLFFFLLFPFSSSIQFLLPVPYSQLMTLLPVTQRTQAVRRTAATLTLLAPLSLRPVFPPEAVVAAGPAPEPGSPAPLTQPRAQAQKCYQLLSIISIARLPCESSHRQTAGSSIPHPQKTKTKNKLAYFSEKTWQVFR